MSARNVLLDHLLGVYRVGSGDWPWREEYDNLINQPDTQKLLARIREEGIREPVLLGTDGRIWDGHHRIIIAMHLGLDSVPVEFAGEEGALVAHDAAKRAEWEADQGETEWGYLSGETNIAGDPHVQSVGADGEPFTREQASSRGRPAMRRTKGIPAGPWMPVPDTTGAES